MNTFDPQKILSDGLVTLVPLQNSDFERLYAVACDPLIWAQHPNKERYQREVFKTFFEGALASKGAYLIFDKQSGELIGSSRYYDADPETRSILIGYTFLARSHWGGRYNPAIKRLMIDHALSAFDSVIFHVGASNIRSQKAMEKLGAKKTGESGIAYYGEPSKLNVVYVIQKSDWPT